MQPPVTIITQNPHMRTIISLLNKVVNSESSILLIGETGVGKEIFAEYIHSISNRSNRPFVKIGLAALPSELLASELFGYEKGAFTNAFQQKKGLFEVANTGSIFLDDIDDVSIEMQIKLLRALESREIMRVGGTSTIPVDIRLISASKVNLKELMKRNLFRADLFYRITVVPVEIPPLRNRKEDISLLMDYYLNKFAPEKKLTLTPEALQAITLYDWPGNVRELRNVAQHVSLFAEKYVQVSDLPNEILSLSELPFTGCNCHLCLVEKGMSYTNIMECIETHIFQYTLNKTHGNQSEAARILHLSISTFRDKMKKLEVAGVDFHVQ
jgi:transcriptional regulator with PAS, ATPase and Fis domain